MHPKLANNIIDEADKLIKEINSLIARNTINSNQIQLPPEVLATLYLAKGEAIRAKTQAGVSRWNATGHLASAIENFADNESTTQELIRQGLRAKMTPEAREQLDKAVEGFLNIQRAAADALKG